MATDHTDLISVILSDHRAVESAFAELESGQVTTEHRRDLSPSPCVVCSG